MRNLIISILMVIVLVVVNIAIANYLGEQTKYFEETADEIIALIDAEEYVQASEMLKEYMQSWDEGEAHYKSISGHEVVEDIGANLMRAQTHLEREDAIHAIAELKHAVHDMKHIYDSEKVVSGNIF
jgi:uncharacterized protein YpmB